MKKIPNKKERLQAEIASKIICSARKKGKHCLKQCWHGRLHDKDTERGSCHQTEEFCNLSLGGIIKVKCKPLSKKAQNEWVKEELSK